MFGIVPKPLWQRLSPADEKNRIRLACNCLLVEWPHSDRRVIVETGHGPKYGAKEQEIFAIDPERWLLAGLRAAAVEPESITDVVVTHLHFDHAGGLTWEREGVLAATFPNARVHVQRQEFADARDNYSTMKTTYRAENLEPIAAGAWVLHEGPGECVPGVEVLPTPGHTRGHQSVLVRGSERTGFFPGDLLPTAAHVGAPYNMAYDLFPLENRESKQTCLRRAAEERWLIFLGHERHRPVAGVVPDGQWFRLEPIEQAIRPD